MAMVKLGDGVIEIEGKSGGDIYRKDQCGQHVQATPRHVRRNPSPQQVSRQRAWRACHNYIQRHSSTEFVYRWQHYAYQHPRTNKKGEKYILTWWQQFFAINIIRVYNNLPILESPPED